MLWSDLRNERENKREGKPPKELREAQVMLRRLGLLMALAVLLAIPAIGLR